LRRCWLKGRGFYGPRGTIAFFEPVGVTEELRTVARLGSWAEMIEGSSSALRVHHVDGAMQSL